MNDHFASIVHRDRMAAYRAEADSERLIANASLERPVRAGMSEARRWLASVASALLLIVGRSRLGLYRRVSRLVRGVVIALVLAVVWAAPTAAAQPSRVVYDLSPFELPAGTACAFDVRGEPSGGFVAVTSFRDGTVMHSVRARGAYVNLETGARFPTLDTSRVIDRFDPATGIDVVEVEGQNSYNFLPGDVGPFGVVGPNAAFYHIVGAVSFTWDSVANHVTQFAYSGTVTDICAALS